MLRRIAQIRRVDLARSVVILGRKDELAVLGPEEVADAIIALEDLPRASSEPEQPKPQNILFSVTADGSYYWNEQKIDDSELPNRLAAEAAKEPQPELHIRGDKAVRYERVAKAMSEAREAGVRKIGFITEPEAK